ncbi:hypothetical protein FHS20_003811 [Phyllobacterium endophyticum]|nr:hypothetical protein [Phyllobacterium endophyticum]
MHDKPVALVTGANRGIGLQIAKELTARGLTVLIGSRDFERGQAAAIEVGPTAVALQLDVTDKTSIAAAAERVRREFGIGNVIRDRDTHPDHVGNLRTADGGKAFPRATVFLPKADWEFFVRNDPDLSYMPVPEDFRVRFGAAIKSSLEPVTKDVELYEAGAEIVPGLTTIVAPGNTPGMATFLVHSGNDQLLLTADLAYHPVVNIDNPWLPGPDRDKETALASRRRIFDMAAADRIPVLDFHYPFPGLGRMLKTDGGYAWVPAGWQF